jgi:hypothetical protein
MTVWHKSSHSGVTECVEIGRDGSAQIWMRDSKHPEGNRLPLPSGDWMVFLEAVRHGQLDSFTR